MKILRMTMLCVAVLAGYCLLWAIGLWLLVRLVRVGEMLGF